MIEAFNRVLGRYRRSARERKELQDIPRLPFDASSLRACRNDFVAALFTSPETDHLWAQAQGDLARICRIEDLKTAAVNPGDRRAVWYLIIGLKSASVLEIGTNVGGSTAHIVSALKHGAPRSALADPKLVTVDFVDVNDDGESYWRKAGLARSPRSMIQQLGCDHLVHFVTEHSLSYLDRCTDQYDFIFLDGDHRAMMVYQEIQKSLRLLKKDGVILLHDYFPDNRPLWTNGAVEPGPHIAVSRLQREGVPIRVIPLGDLPWPTKLNSRTTSLALATRC